MHANAPFLGSPISGSFAFFAITDFGVFRGLQG